MTDSSDICSKADPTITRDSRAAVVSGTSTADVITVNARKKSGEARQIEVGEGESSDMTDKQDLVITHLSRTDTPSKPVRTQRQTEGEHNQASCLGWTAYLA
jgi:hypothetical protein